MSWEKGEGDMASEKLLQALPPESERMDAGPEKTTNIFVCCLQKFTWTREFFCQ